MIINFSILLGAGLGAFTAIRKKGNLLDIAQYIAIYALVFGMVTLFFIILFNRPV